MAITIRYQEINDAERFYEILSNPNFIYFNVKPKNIEDEKKWLQGNLERRENNTEWDYAVHQIFS